MINMCAYYQALDLSTKLTYTIWAALTYTSKASLLRIVDGYNDLQQQLFQEYVNVQNVIVFEISYLKVENSLFFFAVIKVNQVIKTDFM